MNDTMLARPSLEASHGAELSGTDRWLAAIEGSGLDAALLACSEPFAMGPLTLPDGRQVAAVDRFAVKTLCWRLDDGKLRVAERASDLVDGATPIDPQAIFDFFYFHVVPSPRTIYSGIHRLPPGHLLIVDHGRASVRPYWTACFEPNQQPSFESSRAEFRALLTLAVRRRLDGGTPACFLSGGTDSSTLAGLVGEVAGQPAATYAIGFDAAGYDEMEYARLAARRFGTRHHEYYMTPDDLVRGIPLVAGAYDQPFGNSSALPAWCCAVRARNDGVTRILAGDGGDELFGGNTRYAMQRVYGWYQSLPQALRRGALEPFFSLPAVARAPLIRKGSGYIRYANTPMPDRLQVHNLLHRLGVDQVLTPAVLSLVESDAPMRQQREVWAAAQAPGELNRALAFDWRYTLAENDLPKVRGTSQLAGIEVGYPLLDHDLLAFSMQLPEDWKVRGLRLRWFFKEALRGFLPDEIIRKKKHGFGLPFGVWALKHPGLLALAADSARGLAERGVIRPAFVELLLTQLLAEAPGYYGEMLWIVMMLEQWLREHAPEWRLAD
jgi:asparagine synthase (glutamine-hydrolysing)